ncbi:MAG: hypothetical protein M3Y55_14780 [Pseudomonadota bacterium]|nr:hypothetical protein [Pseudomonadota bacterium]
MKRSLSLALAGALFAVGVHAQTLRWASQGDPQTMDPHSQNESGTNMMNGQVTTGATRTMSSTRSPRSRASSRMQPSARHS